MPTDTVRERWSRDEPVLNAWSLSADAATAATLASADGIRTVTLDLQYGRAEASAVAPFAAAVERASAVPLVRLRWNRPDEVMRALDLGARGAICPMVGDGDEAVRFVTAARYPPAGIRSYGPVAGAFGSGLDHVRAADGDVLLFAMIETSDGLSNVDEIAATPGLDGLYVGPADLSLSLGVSTFADLTDARLLEALDAVVHACASAGVVAGVHASAPDPAAAMIERGFRFVTPIVDDDALSLSAETAARATLTSFSRSSPDDP